MAAFLELSPDAFTTSFRSLTDSLVADRRITSDGKTNSGGLFDHVRRPTRGLQVKDDTYATLQVRTADGQELPLVDAGGWTVDSRKGFSVRYSNFLMQSLTEARQEKTQIVQTFGESYVFFYGEQPRMLEVQGVLINSEDFNWRAEWWENYDKYLRGSACVRTKSRVYLSWDDIVVEGYIMGSQASEQATEPHLIPFSFTLFLTNYQNISDIGNPQFPKAGTEVQLDPFSTDTTGEGIGNLQSDTLAVRTLNQISEMTSSSLLASVQAGVSFVLSASDDGGSGGLGFGLSIAFTGLDLSAILSGRVVRVPIGFGGGSVFDDVQFALQSIPPPPSGRGEVTLNSDQLGDFAFSVFANIPAKFLPARYGLIALNLDEYIGRAPQSAAKPTPAPDVFAVQRATDSQVTDQVKAIYAEFGIDTDPPNEALILAAHLAFGMLSVGIGAALL